MPSFPQGGGSLSPAGLPAYEFFTGSNGSDGASGSQGSPLRTLYAAAQAAIAKGGGTINYNASTPIGGPVSGQGLWLRNDGITVPGFLNMNGARLRFIGQGNQSGQYVFERPGAATMTTSTTSDFYKPALWLVGTELPLDFDFGKSFIAPIYGMAAPCRIGWDYVRKNSGAREDINVSTAVRAAGSTTLTLDLSTLTAFTVLTGVRDANDVVTLTLQLPANLNATPWVVGSYIKLVTSDADFPTGNSLLVTAQSDSFAQQTPGSIVSVSFTQAGNTISSPQAVTGGTIVSHGLAVKDRIAMTSVNAQFPNCCMMRVTGVTNATTVVVRDPYGYGSRSASTTQNNIGTIVKQSRGRSAVSAVSMYRSSIFGLTTGLGDFPSYGPAVDIGCVSANPIRFEQCYFTGGLNWNWQDVSIDNVDFDRTKVAIFGDPGAGNAGATAVEATDCQSQDGCIRFYGGGAAQGGNSLLVDQWLQDTGGDPVPTVSIVEGTAFDSYTLKRVSIADDSVEAINICAGLDPLRIVIGEIYSQAAIPIVNLSGFVGPTNVRSALWTGQGTPLPSPWESDWRMPAWPGGLAIKHPGANRALGPVAARFANMFPPLANWTDGSAFPTGITVTQDGLGPDGASKAFKIVATGSFVLDTILIGLYPATLSASVGDFVAFGCWMKSAVPCSLRLSAFAVNDIKFSGSDSISSERHIGVDGWQWCPTFAKVTAITNGHYFLSLAIPSGAGTYLIWGPTFVKVAASVGAADFYEFAGTLKHQPIYLAAGQTGTMESQKFIAHDGLGTNSANSKTVGVASGQLTLTGTGTVYLPTYGADGTTIIGWVAQLQATINP